MPVSFCRSGDKREALTVRRPADAACAFGRAGQRSGVPPADEIRISALSSCWLQVDRSQTEKTMVLPVWGECYFADGLKASVSAAETGSRTADCGMDRRAAM